MEMLAFAQNGIPPSELRGLTPLQKQAIAMAIEDQATQSRE